MGRPPATNRRNRTPTKAAAPEQAAATSPIPFVADLIDQWEQQRPDLTFWSLRLHATIGVLERSLSRFLEPTFEALGIKGGDYEILSILRRQGAPYQASPTDISKALHLTTGAITRRLDRVETAGLVRRVRNGADRRAISVELTDAGLATVDQGVELLLLATAELFDPVRAQTVTFEEFAQAVMNRAVELSRRASAHDDAT